MSRLRIMDHKPGIIIERSAEECRRLALLHDQAAWLLKEENPAEAMRHKAETQRMRDEIGIGIF